jgi:hypothetical protein
MGISANQIYRVREDKRHINQKFIIGATKVFAEHKLDEFFYSPTIIGNIFPRQASRKNTEYGEFTANAGKNYPNYIGLCPICLTSPTSAVIITMTWIFASPPS